MLRFRWFALLCLVLVLVVGVVVLLWPAPIPQAPEEESPAPIKSVPEQASAQPPATQPREEVPTNRIVSNAQLRENYRVVNSLILQARNQIGADHLTDAIETQRQVVERLRLLDGEGHTRLQLARNALREMESEMALGAVQKTQLAKSRVLVAEALAITEPAQSERAVELVNKGIQLYRTIFPEARFELIGFYQSLGSCLAKSPQPERALEPLNQAKTLMIQLAATDIDDYAELLMVIADLQIRLDRSVEARPNYEQAVSILERYIVDCLESEVPDAVGRLERALRTLGNLLMDAKEYSTARAIQLKACAVVKAYEPGGEKSLMYAQCLLALAQSELELKLGTEAESHLGQAELIVSTKSENDSLDHFAILVLRTKCAVFRQDLEAASSTLERLVQIHKTLKNLDPSLLLAVLNMKTSVYFAQGKYSDSTTSSSEAYQLCAKIHGDSHPLTIETLGDYGLSLLGSGQPQEAEKELRRWLIANRLRIDVISPGQTPTARREKLGGVSIILDAYLTAALRSSASVAQIYDAVAVWKGADRAAALRDLGDFDDPATQPFLQAMATLQTQLAQLAVQPIVPGEEDRWKSKFDQLFVVSERLEKDLASARVQSRRAAELSQPSTQSVAKALQNPDSAFVDFVSYQPLFPRNQNPPECLLAFVHRPGVAPVLIKLSETVTTSELVSRYRVALSRQRHDDVDKIGRELGAIVWEPLRPHLKSVRRVFLSPVGSLQWVSFAGLPMEAPTKSYVVESVAIGYVDSAYDLVTSLDKPARNLGVPGLLMVGDLNYGPISSRVAIKSLVNGRTELKAVRERFQTRFANTPVESWMGESVNRQRVSEALLKGEGNRRYQFWSTHGFFRRPQPDAVLNTSRGRNSLWESSAMRQLLVMSRCPRISAGLSLSGANLHSLNGEMTAQELQMFDMRGCELVYLSACHTDSIGEIQGEGSMGLIQSFRSAGVRSAVTTCWALDEDSASALSRAYYRQLWPTDPAAPQGLKLESLQAAQLELLFGSASESSKKGNQPTIPPVVLKKTPPYFWAALVHHGDPN
jgi:CHAT domain-containing protein/tetratricopeptide (TPR) repeat protein